MPISRTAQSTPDNHHPTISSISPERSTMIVSLYSEFSTTIIISTITLNAAGGVIGASSS